MLFAKKIEPTLQQTFFVTNSLRAHSAELVSVPFNALHGQSALHMSPGATYNFLPMKERDGEPTAVFKERALFLVLS